MFNRTNRTLSANLNRLNLGTRSLALQACVNDGKTLRLLADFTSHPGVITRAERMRSAPAMPMPSYRPAKPAGKRGAIGLGGAVASPASSSWSSWSRPSWPSDRDDRSQVRVLADAPPVFRPVVEFDVPTERPVQQPGQPAQEGPARARGAARPASRSARPIPLASAAAS